LPSVAQYTLLACQAVLVKAEKTRDLFNAMQDAMQDSGGAQRGNGAAYRFIKERDFRRV
jgi:hypothetical protein